MNGTLLNDPEAIGEEFVTRLEQVKTVNGFETDLGVKVYRGLRKVDPKMVPCCVVIEAPDEVARLNVRTQFKVVLPFVLLAYLPCDAQNPNVAAHAGLRDLKRAIFQTNGEPDFRLGGKVAELEYRGRDIGPRGDGQAFVCAAIEVAVSYTENIGKA